MGLFRKGKTHITAKFQMTDLVIFSNSRQGNPCHKPNKYGNTTVGKLCQLLTSSLIKDYYSR